MPHRSRRVHGLLALAIVALLACAVPVAAQHDPPDRDVTSQDEGPEARTLRVTGDPTPQTAAARPATGDPQAPPAQAAAASQPATAVPAGPAPVDYTAIAGLSQPDYPETVRDVHRVAMHDGVELYVEVVRPDPDVHGDGPWPVVMEASPYHGTLADRSGTRIFPDPTDPDGTPLGLTGYFAPRGYAVAMVDLRGTGRSAGCLDYLGPEDARDLKTVVEWAADAPWSTGRVGMTGHSYVGSTPVVAAAQNPRGLTTIATSAGLASMYDHQFHNGVPWFLQLAGPMYAYAELSTLRHLPGDIDTPLGPTGDDFGNNLRYTGCGWLQSSLLAGHGQLTGQYQAWHAKRDYRAAATAADVPIFMIHGVNDNAARIPSSEWFFGERFDRPGDKVWLGQWDHGSAGLTTCDEAHVNCRFDQWTSALHAWFDRHLQQRDVATGPPVEVFLNGDQVTTADRWRPAPDTLHLRADARDGSLGETAPDEAGSASFTSVPTGPTTSLGAVEFLSEPMAEDVVVAGVPELRLRASLVSAQLLNLVAGVYRVDAAGDRHPLGYCAVQPQLRHDVRTPELIVPGQQMDLEPQCFTMAHHIPAGERLLLQVATSSPHHVSTHTLELLATVHTGPGATELVLPVRPGAKLHDDDVPLHVDAPVAEPPAGPAEPPVSGTVAAPAPGAGTRGPATSAYFEFEVTEPTSAALDAVATWLVPGDYDLYLQRERDGGWSPDLAAGESSSVEDERLHHAGLRPGRYRLEVHNWSGAPVQPIELQITFLNREGEPG